ncbi:MAG: anhydro-N-acetylmuramic acid kinase [Gemmatimonadota bacterium]
MLLPSSAGPAHVIGLISGTSADGVDAALCRLACPAPPDGGVLPAGALRVETLAARTAPYAPSLRERVLGAAGLRVPELAALHVELGEVFADAAAEICRIAGTPLEVVDLIGSHGQTVWHDPRGLLGGRPATLQLAQPAVIAARTACDVVADFRPSDVALGGEGAPLVPLVDFLLLERPGSRRAVLNLGGIANVAWLPGTGRAEDVVAFDTGPGNMLLDGLVRRFELAAEGYDSGGRLAARGRVGAELLAELSAEPFFAEPPPRSTGRELFGQAFAERVAGRGRELGLEPIDVLATATALTAESAASSILRFGGSPDEVLLCGGGRHNHALREALWERLPGAALRDTDEEGIDGDAKEAVAFAVLGYLAARGIANHLPHTTGASRRTLLGTLVRGRPA